MNTNLPRKLVLAARPVGEPRASDFKVVAEPLSELADGEFAVEITHISVDPAMRGWMSDAPSYIPPVEIGSVMRAFALGRVTTTRNESFSEGDVVHGIFGVQEHAISNGENVTKIIPTTDISIAAHLGVFGVPGLTAYFGLLDVGVLEEGNTVLISGAAGAVGTIAGQIAKIKGARVIGLAGGPEKCQFLVDTLGFDGAIDYKAGDVYGQLAKHTPNGIDVFFDNVGGEILDLGLSRLARNARVVICGAISQYNATGATRGPSNYMALLIERASMSGFLVFDYVSRFPEAVSDMSTWLAEGRLSSIEDTVAGTIEDLPAMLLAQFSGQNLGKLVLELTR